MIINCKLAVQPSAFLTLPFHFSPVLYQSMIPDFSYQRPDPKHKKSAEALPPALLGFGLGPSEEERTQSLDKWPLTLGSFCQHILVSKTDNISFPNLLMDSLFSFSGFPILCHSLPLLGEEKKKGYRVGKTGCLHSSTPCLDSN